MPHQVSSWFVTKNSENFVSPVLKFTIGGSDYSSYVTKWPKFTVNWDSIRATNTIIDLSNEDGTFLFFKEDKTKLLSNAKVEFGHEFVNLLQWSQDIDNPQWLKTRCVVTPNAVVAPDGTLTADRITHITSDAYNSIFQTDTQSVDMNGKTFTASVWIWTDSGTNYDNLIMYINNNGTYPIYSKAFNVNQYQNRVSFSFVYPSHSPTVNYGTSMAMRLWTLNANSGTYLYFWGAQIEEGGNATAYQSVESYTNDELLTLFSGTVDYVKYEDTKCKVSITNKFKQLSERLAGTRENPVDFTGSDYLPSDIAFWLVTSYGGFSSVQNSSNPDIDYSSFSEWANVFSSSSILVRGSFSGQKVTECIRKIGRITRSAIYIEEDKIKFKRFSIADAYTAELTDSDYNRVQVTIDDSTIINKQYVYADYDITSEYYKITVSDQDSSSVGSFGLRDGQEEDLNIWYANSVSALDLAQRVVNTNKLPYDSIDVKSTLKIMPATIGDTLTVVSSIQGLYGEGFRVMDKSIDLDKCEISITLDRSQYFGGFFLDTSTLDGSDILT